MISSRAFGIDPLSAYLATSPGGIDAMLIIAASVHVNLPIYPRAQLVRFLMVLALGRPLGRFIARRERVRLGGPRKSPVIAPWEPPKNYRAPLRDIAFSLTEVAGVDQLAATGAFPDFDADLMKAVLEAAGSFSDEVLAPLNRVGDLNGATYANGSVTAAPGFAEAYRQFAEGGWTGLTASEEAGGQALPKALELAAYETVQGANMAFALCPMLSLAAIEALEQHGTEEHKRVYLPKLVSRRMGRRHGADRAGGRHRSGRADDDGDAERRRPHTP